MKNNFLFRNAALLLCCAALVLASCRKDDKTPAGENGMATVKYALDVTSDDHRDWGEAADWLGDGGRLSMLGNPQLPVKRKDLFENVPTGILVKEQSYVYVTFVGEIADFNNVLGYYYYNPQQTGGLDEEGFLNQLFLSGEDGNVYFQNIIYTQTKRLAHGYTFMLGIQEGNGVAPFDEGTVVGFCIFPNSGSGDGLSPINDWGGLPAIKLRDGNKPFYITTDWQFNEGKTLSHTVLQTPCGEYVFAFEDLNSAYSKSSDDDFNDLVLVVGDNLDNRKTENMEPYGLPTGAIPYKIPERPGDEGECGQAVIDELKVTPAELTLQINERYRVAIEGGSGEYSIEGVKDTIDITGKDADIAGYALDGNTLIMKGRQPGNATVTVKDNATGATAALTLTVPEKTIPTNTALIPWGKFMMGSPEDEPGRSLREETETQHEVYLTRTFAMSQYEMTNAQYAAFLNARNIGSDGKNPDGQLLIYSYTLGVQYTSGKWTSYITGNENHPLVYVTWYGAEEFCRWVSGRLPTEAEWEYACRAGTTTAYSFGAIMDASYANCYNGGVIPSLVVGSLKPNSWGLYDMHGNMAEWCNDWWDSRYYISSPTVDPPGPDGGRDRVWRGGGFGFSPEDCRSAFRYGMSPGSSHFYMGFRVAFDIK